MAIWGYSDLDGLIKTHLNIKNGILVDTNILVAATYDMDEYHEVAKSFIDNLIENNIPLYCNVNIRAEFLDIHSFFVLALLLTEFPSAPCGGQMLISIEPIIQLSLQFAEVIFLVVCHSIESFDLLSGSYFTL